MVKSYTDIEQSRKLAEILSLESADMRYAPFGDTHPWFWDGHLLEKGAIPCWSLAALFNVLPEGIIANHFVPNLQKENGKYSIAYGTGESLCVADNPVDACVEMILKLHELNLL